MFRKRLFVLLIGMLLLFGAAFPFFADVRDTMKLPAGFEFGTYKTKPWAGQH